jgi:glycosyltransferase involved in cell wall biosynthesis
MSARATVAAVLRTALRLWARGVGRRRGRDGGPRRICILLMHAWGMGGTIRTVLNLAGDLARHREVEILSVVRRRDRPFFGEFPPGVTVTALDDQRAAATPPWLRPLRSFLSRRPSVLFPREDRASRAVSLWADVMLARTLRRRSGATLIGTRPGLNAVVVQLAGPAAVRIGQEHMNLSAHRPALRKMLRRTYPQLDALVALTERDRGEYADLFGGVLRVEAIPNAVTPFEGAPSDLSSPIVLAAGRLKRQKDFGRLIRAFAAVAPTHPDWRLRICGSGPRRAALERLIEEHRLDGSVVLAGSVADMEPEFEGASIFAMSSRREGFPMVLLEAMSKGLPVVSFDSPTGPREIVRDGANGLLVPYQNVRALAIALGAMIDDEELRRRCARGAIATAREYELSSIGSRWRELLAVLEARR